MKQFKKSAIVVLLCITGYYSYGVTAARLINDADLGDPGITYIASINTLSDPIKVTSTDYGSSMNQTFIPTDIPANYRPALADSSSAYAQEHSDLNYMGLAFSNFPNGVSGGFSYHVTCGNSPLDPQKSTCWLDGTPEARIHYTTMCRGKPVYFNVHAWHGRETGGVDIAEAVAELGGSYVGAAAISYIAIVNAGFRANMTYAQLMDALEAPGMPSLYTLVFASPQTLGLSAIAAGGIIAFNQLKSYTGKTTIYSDNSYINIEADSPSSITPMSGDKDTIFMQQTTIDNCLKISAQLIEAPYIMEKENNHNVPTNNDAVVAMTFSPIYSATDTCALNNDATSTISGQCKDNSQQWQNTSLNYNDSCAIGSDVINNNGVLQCETPKIPPQPTGGYLQACSVINWDGAVLKAKCGPFDYPSFPSLNYANSCKNGSTVSFTGYGIYGKLVCDTPLSSKPNNKTTSYLTKLKNLAKSNSRFW